GQTVAVQVLDARTGRPLEDAEVLVTLSGDATNGAIETMAFTDGIWSLVPRFAVFDSLMEAFQSLGGAAVVYVPLTRVDKQGLAHLRGLRRGRFAAIVTRRGYAPVLVRSDDASGALEVSMEPGGSLRVVAPETDADTAAALVCEINRPGVFLPMPVDRATVDAQGEARFEDITPGLYEVVVSKRGTWSIDVTAPTDEREGQLNVGRNTNDVVARRTVEVAAGAAVTVDFRKDTSVSIEGKVNTALTVPWTVRLMHGGSELGTKTIAAGKTFRFETVAAGTYELIATGIQGGGVIRKTVEVAAGAGSVFVSLEAKIGGIRGTVTRDGRPVNGATMLALPYERARALAWVAPATTTELLTLLGASFRSDESGSFAQPLHAGRYMVFAALAGVLDQREVVVRESESAAIRFELGGTRVFPLEIALTNANGDPLDGHVLVRGYYGGFVAAFLLDRGAFDPDAAPRRKLVYHVPAGRYLVDVLAAGQAPVRSLPVHTKGEYTLTIPMRPGVAATITLETERGPLAGVDLDVRDARGLPIPRRAHPSVLFSRSHPWRTDKGGVVSIPHLLPGDYRLFRNDRELAAFRVRSEPVVRTIRVSSE
ncbi:MAG: hypothetical protein OER88_05765, partial [Planctomycetota bacterium]|nr:hypothetical protein [Planctomycetota bacterium]